MAQTLVNFRIDEETTIYYNTIYCVKENIYEMFILRMRRQ